MFLSKYTKGILIISVLIISVVVFGVPNTFAQSNFNKEINYQGKLTNAAGATVADGLYDMEFVLYDAPTGGSVLWTETLTGANQVQVTSGLFSVMLGSTTALTGVNFNQTLYLGVNIESDGEMVPRKILGAVPAAFEADNANTVGGVASTSFIRSDVADTASGLLTFTGGLISSASSTLANLNFTTATGTTLVINGEAFTDFTGTALTNNAGVLSVSTSTLAQYFASTSAFDTSAELAAILFDETGTGNLVFSASPTFTGTTVFASASTTNLVVSGVATTSSLAVLGRLYGNNGSAGTNGMVLQSTGSGFNWVATSSLGFSSSFSNSAQLASLLSDETGSGLSVFSVGATLSTTTLTGTTTISGNIVLPATTTVGSNLFVRTGAHNLTLTTTATTNVTLPTTGTLATLAGTETFTNKTLTSPTLTTPRAAIIYGGTAVGSTLTLRSTTGVGSGDAIIFGVGNNGATESMRIVASGNVGIGTTTANTRLTVGGAAFIGGNLTATGTLSVSGLSTLANASSTALSVSGALYGNNGSAGTNGMVLQSTGSGFDWVATSTLGFASTSALANYLPLTGGSLSGNLTFSGTTANVALGSNYIGNDGDDEGLSFDTSGRATFSSNSGGTVFTTLHNTNTSLGSTVSWLFDLGTSITVGSILSGYETTSATGYLAFSTREASVNTEHMRLSSAGNLGIGTTSPAQLLSVAGNAYITGALYGNNGSAGTNGMVLQSTGSGFNWVATSTLGITSPFGVAINANELASEDFGSFTCNGTTCTIDNSALTAAMQADGDHGFFSYTSGVASLDTGGLTSANLISAVSDETGTGNLVFSASPTFTGTINAAAATLSSTLTLSGSAANIALGSNWLSGDGDDEGIFVSSTGDVGIGTSSPASKLDVWGNLRVGTSSTPALLVNTTNGRVALGTTTPESILSINNTGLTGSVTGGINKYIGLSNTTLDAVQYGDRSYININSTATSTVVGGIVRLADNTTLGNVVRGFEVQAFRGANTQGENTALSGFARTFGVRGKTEGDAGGLYEPAGGFFETGGTTQGNAIRGYSASITTADMLSLFQETSAFAGTGLLMNFGNNSGTFASTSSKFVDFQNAGTSKFTVTAHGTTTIGDGTTNNQAGLQIGYGGLCVDNDGTCTASTTGRISSVSTYAGNSDLAEMYFSSQNLLPGEIVTTDGFLSVRRATEDTKERVLGVISTKPGLLLGYDDSSLIANQSGYPVALSGRVPVRLSDENGPITVGDPLTLSSLPGIAMKATEADMIVGYALESYDGTHAYTEGFVDQFGDDVSEPNYEALYENTDALSKGGCHFGGGVATGEIEPECEPTDLDAIADAKAKQEAIARARFEAEQAALQALRNEPAEVLTTASGTVRVGQIIMFVDKGYYQLMSQTDVLNELVSTSTELVLGAAEGSEETLWSRLKLLAQNFVDGVLTIAGIKTEKIETSELCVDDVCINATELRALLEASNNEGQIVQVQPVGDTHTTDEEVVDEVSATTESTGSATNNNLTETASSTSELDTIETASSTAAIEEQDDANNEFNEEAPVTEPIVVTDTINPKIIVDSESVEPQPEIVSASEEQEILSSSQ